MWQAGGICIVPSKVGDVCCFTLQQQRYFNHFAAVMRCEEIESPSLYLYRLKG
jgi:hypothetical protein